MKSLLILLLLSATAMSTGCSQESVANRGFALPPGNAEQGHAAFISYRCVECHTLSSAELVSKDWQYNEKRTISVMIGGKSTKVQTYGDLVTSIINPSHRIANGYVKADLVDANGESKMRVYNDVMTVTELVDLVTFLYPQYELVLPPMMTYEPYTYHN